MNQVFSLIASISSDKSEKVKDSSTLNEHESCLVARAGLEPSILELSKIVHPLIVNCDSRI